MHNENSFSFQGEKIEHKTKDLTASLTRQQADSEHCSQQSDWHFNVVSKVVSKTSYFSTPSGLRIALELTKAELSVPVTGCDSPCLHFLPKALASIWEQLQSILMKTHVYNMVH